LLNNIGCSLFELNELKGAKIAFEEALIIQRTMMRTASPVNSVTVEAPNQVLLSIASTLCNIGSIKLRWGEFEEAILALEEALLVRFSMHTFCLSFLKMNQALMCILLFSASFPTKLL
jgi:hypothetical protein